MLLPSAHIKLFGARFGLAWHWQVLGRLAIVAGARVTATRAIIDSNKDIIPAKETKIDNGKFYANRVSEKECQRAALSGQTNRKKKNTKNTPTFNKPKKGGQRKNKAK